MHSALKVRFHIENIWILRIPWMILMFSIQFLLNLKAETEIIRKAFHSFLPVCIVYKYSLRNHHQFLNIIFYARRSLRRLCQKIFRSVQKEYCVKFESLIPYLFYITFNFCLIYFKLFSGGFRKNS